MRPIDSLKFLVAHLAPGSSVKEAACVVETRLIGAHRFGSKRLGGIKASTARSGPRAKLSILATTHDEFHPRGHFLEKDAIAEAAVEGHQQVLIGSPGCIEACPKLTQGLQGHSAGSSFAALSLVESVFLRVGLASGFFNYRHFIKADRDGARRDCLLLVLSALVEGQRRRYCTKRRP